MNEDAALAAVLGHIQVLQKTLGLSDAETLTTVQRAVEHLRGAQAQTAVETPSVDAFTPQMASPVKNAVPLDSAFNTDDTGFDDSDFEPTDPALNEIALNAGAGEPTEHLPPEMFASAVSSSDGAPVSSELLPEPPPAVVVPTPPSAELDLASEIEAAIDFGDLEANATASNLGDAGAEFNLGEALDLGLDDVPPTGAPSPPMGTPPPLDLSFEATAPAASSADLDATLDLQNASPVIVPEAPALGDVAAPIIPAAPPAAIIPPAPVAAAVPAPTASTVPAPTVPAPTVPAPSTPVPTAPAMVPAPGAPANTAALFGTEPAPPADALVPPAPISLQLDDSASVAAVLSQADALDDLLPPEVTIPDAPAVLSETSAPSVEAMRSVPRFRNRTEVDVHLDGRDALQTLWTKDISKGGLFVTTHEPPPSGTQVTVQLQTPDGSLRLKAEVVHVLDAATAQGAGIDPGVGLQFVDLDNERRSALESYVDGIAAKLEDGSQQDVVDAAAADRLQIARTFLRKVDDGHLYEALRVPPETSHEVLRDTIAALRAKLSSEMTGLNESDRGRLERAGRVLDRVQKVMLEPIRRVDYDFRQDIVRAEARIQTARETGEDIATIRSIWERVWPDRIKEAAEWVAKAVTAIKEEGNFLAAVEFGEKALVLDPFNLELLTAHKSWGIVVSLPDAFASGDVDVDNWINVASSHQIDLAVLRGVWQHVQPEKIKTASDYARKAMAADGAHAFDQAVEQGELALALDPFNAELRGAIETWRQKSTDASASAS